MDASHPDVGTAIRSSGDLSEETEASLRAAVRAVQGDLRLLRRRSAPKEAEAEALSEEEEERVRRYRRRPDAGRVVESDRAEG